MSGTNSAERPPQAPEPLGLTVHSLPDPAAQRRAGRWRMLAILLVCAAPVMASYFTYFVLRPSDGAAAYGTLIDPAREMPPLQAQDLDGRPVMLASLKRQWLLVVVADASCGEACEQQLFVQRQLREMLGRERDRVDKLWIVTGEGAVAQPLRRALAATPAMHLQRLPEAAVQSWLQPAAGQALADHLYIVDPMGRWMMRMPPQAQPARIKRDLDRLLRASASWDQPGR